jgi:hypothetical protein
VVTAAQGGAREDRVGAEDRSENLVSALPEALPFFPDGSIAGSRACSPPVSFWTPTNGVTALTPGSGCAQLVHILGTRHR